MRLHLRLGRTGLLLGPAIAVGLLAPRPASAETITINDGAAPGLAEIPFTCSIGTDNDIWLPYMGFVYRNVEPFELVPGDIIAFDIALRSTDPADMGFSPQLDIALAYAPDPANPFRPADLPGTSDFTVVAQDGIAASRGNHVVEDYDLAFTVDAPFKFPGGNLIIRVSDPMGALATRTSLDCLPVISADLQPSGSNRLVGTFKMEDGEFPWFREILASPNVPYVRIIWSRCGDGKVSGNEQCDDGNADNDDDCTISCLAPACGDGYLQPLAGEDCDNSANPDDPDPFCQDDCKITVFAKGSGCETGGGVGLAVVLVMIGLAIVLRRRAAGPAVVLAIVAWAGSARAQAMKTDGFRVDRFEMAPSVQDGIVVQDPVVLPNMVWNVNATLGFSNTLLRVVPTLDSDEGVDVVGPRLSAYLDFAMGFRERFEVHASLPFALAQASQSGVAAGIMLREAGTTAVGDGRVGGSVLLYGKRTGPRVGLGATLAVPLGSETSFTGDGGFGGELVATGGYAMPRYRVILNAGVRLRPEADYITSDQGTEYIARGGVVVPFLENRLHTSLELDMLARTSGDDPNYEMGAPVLALLGARYHFAGGLHMGAGFGMGLTEAPGSPLVRSVITVGYTPEPKKMSRPGPPRVEQPLDSDKDGIVDNLDKCPDMPEDMDGIQDEDGCPDPDADQDKIVDTQPEPGKPLTLEQVITLPAPIQFKFDTAIMLPGADVYLNQVLDVLKKHPEVLKLEIQGHTSSEGGHEYNMRLSNDRAKAVVKWLVDHGIESKRLVPHGFGLTQPLVPNDTEENRARNRRVQFRLLESAPGLPPVKEDPANQPPPGTQPGAAPPAAPPAAKPAAPPAAKPAAPPTAAPPAAKPAAPPAAAPPAAKPAAPPAPATAPATRP